MQTQEEEGMSAENAIYKACLTRVRLMTTIAAVLGALPIAIGIGAGGDARMSK